MFAVIRIRGSAGVSRGLRDTLKMLRLEAANNCALLPETEDYKGMLEKVRSLVTWGEIDKNVAIAMIEKRMRIAGDKRVDKKILKEITGFDSFEKFADALISSKVKMSDFEKVKPIFRLTPPSKGFKSVKEFYPSGDLGFRGKEINELLERMM